MLHEAVWSEQGAPFLFPWGEVVGLLFACWAVVLLATFTPVRRAARVPPSAALRTV
jgi:ABC-type lipoprotein release transport system permease subunit